MSFAHGWLLAVLGPLVLLWLVLWSGVWRRWLNRRYEGAAALRYSSIAALKRLPPSRLVRLRRAVQALRVPVLVLLALAIARPQQGRTLTQVATEGVDIMLAIDASGSMQALDLDSDQPIPKRRNRLQVVKDVVERFIAKRENDAIGMVVFGAHAFTQCPLTLDHGVVATFLENVHIGIAGDATAIGDGLATAVKRLKDGPAKSKVVVLLTDGRQNTGALTPHKAAEIAKALGIKIYTIGAGTRGQAPFLVETLFGPQVVPQDVDIDEDTLREVATLTGGAYFRAVDAQGLARVYEEIDALERTEIVAKAYMEYDERYPAFVWPALGLLLFEVGLLGTRLRKLP